MATRGTIQPETTMFTVNYTRLHVVDMTEAETDTNLIMLLLIQRGQD